MFDIYRIRTIETSLRYLAMLSLVLVTTFPLPASSQVTENGFSVEEIVVTARRREESLQKVPLSVSAFTPEAMVERAISELGEITRFIPNTTQTSSLVGGSSATYRIRGAGQDDFVTTNEPSVGMYLDGVYIGRVAGAALDLLEIERVEVMRGPQGTLFGRNTIGGAVNVVTADPSTDEFSGYVEAVVGSRSRRDINASVNIPLGDSWAFRGGIAYQQEDGWVESIETGKTFGDEDRLAGRFSLLYDNEDSFRLRLNADFTDDDGEADPAVQVAQAGFSVIPPGFTIPEDGDVMDKTHSGFFAGNDADVSGYSADWTWDFGSMALRSITSYREMEHLSGAEFDGAPSNYFDQLNAVEQDQTSQEFHLLGEREKMDFLFGAFYFSEDVVGTFHYPFVVFGIAGAPPWMYEEQNLLDNQSTGAFANLDFDVSDRLSIGAGVRYTKEDKEIVYNHSWLVPTPNGFVPDPTGMYLGLLKQPLPEEDIAAVLPAVPPDLANQELDFSDTTWRVSMDYEISENAMWFVSISEGFRSGGFNGRLLGNPVGIVSYDPETLRAFEVGFKAQSADGRHMLNGTAFFSDYTDMQISAVLVTPAGPGVATLNAGESEISGLEFEGYSYLTDALRLDYSLGLMTAEYTTLLDGVQANGIDLDDPIALTPDAAFNVGLRYEHEMAGGTLTLRGDYAYTDRYNFLPQANEMDFQEAFGLLNVYLAYTPHSGSWDVALFGSNVLDEAWSYFKEDLRAPPFGIALDYPSPGAEWGLRAGFRF